MLDHSLNEPLCSVKTRGEEKAGRKAEEKKEKYSSYSLTKRKDFST